MRTFVITGTLILASGFAAYASAAAAFDARSPAAIEREAPAGATMTDGVAIEDEGARALGRAILGARSDGAALDACSLPNLS